MALRKKTELGRRYRDKVSGFEGTAVARTEFIYGCFRVTLQAMVAGDVKEFTFDEPGLTEVKEKPVARATVRKTGGTRPTPPRSGLL